MNDVTGLHNKADRFRLRYLKEKNKSDNLKSLLNDETETVPFPVGSSGTMQRLREQALTLVDCAAIPQELIESELFGHEPGAFTGATGRKTGPFGIAWRIFLTYAHNSSRNPTAD